MLQKKDVENKMIVRESTSTEHELIRKIHLAAFDDSERSLVAQLACDLLDERASSVLSLVAEEDGKIVGHIIFSNVSIEGCEEEITAFLLAPLAVVPEHQRKGVGKSMIAKGLSILRENGADLVFVYGDPNYYSRSGFEPATPHGLDTPYELEYPEAWMVLELRQGVLGKGAGLIRCAAPLCSPEYW